MTTYLVHKSYAKPNNDASLKPTLKLCRLLKKLYILPYDEVYLSPEEDHWKINCDLPQSGNDSKKIIRFYSSYEKIHD
jgi:hypothetical protein